MKDPAANMARFRTGDVLAQLALFGVLLGSSVGQRVTFKNLGYALGPYPYFILLFISAAFVLIFAVICTGIVAATGGWLPETRTWRRVGIYCMVGCCNGLQGAAMVFANPHVPGYLQALLQQAVIPFTLIVSVIALSAGYSCRQKIGVMLITVGIALQLLPEAFAAKPTEGHVSVMWSFVFLMGQLPVAAGAVLQEKEFQTVKVNVFHMMFWASAAQLWMLLMLAPIDTIPLVGDSSSMNNLFENMKQGWMLTCYGGAGVAVGNCVVTMLLAQLAQVFLVKYSSAAFAVLCSAFVVPASAAAFASPLLMGSKTEHLGPGAAAALALGCLGIALFRMETLPSCPSPTEDADSERLTPFSAPLIHTPSEPNDPRPLCAPGVGIIQSEYSNARRSPVAVWEECTLKEPPQTQFD